MEQLGDDSIYLRHHPPNVVETPPIKRQYPEPTYSTTPEPILSPQYQKRQRHNSSSMQSERLSTVIESHIQQQNVLLSQQKDLIGRQTQIIVLLQQELYQVKADLSKLIVQREQEHLQRASYSDTYIS